MGLLSRNRSRKDLVKLATERGWKPGETEGNVVVKARLEQFGLHVSSDSNSFSLNKDAAVEKERAIDYCIRRVRITNSDASILDLIRGRWYEPPPEGMMVFETGVTGFDRFFRTRHSTPIAARNLSHASSAIAEVAPLLDGFRRMSFDIMLTPGSMTCTFRKGSGRPSALPVEDFSKILSDYVRFCKVFTTAVRNGR